ncbi:MAG: hypothetical protein AAGG48_23360 [Planctomycetota bacterium]
MKRIALILGSIVLVVLSLYFAWPRASLPVPDLITAMTLYSIDGRGIEDPKPGQPTFRHYPVLGAMDLDDRQQAIVLRALNRGVAAGDAQASCHWPRHGLSITGDGRTVDYSICFECWNIEIVDGTSRTWVSTTPDPQVVLNDLLKDAGIELAPGMIEIP